jgi:hypothetical protein
MSRTTAKSAAPIERVLLQGPETIAALWSGILVDLAPVRVVAAAMPTADEDRRGGSVSPFIYTWAPAAIPVAGSARGSRERLS